MWGIDTFNKTIQESHQEAPLNECAYIFAKGIADIPVYEKLFSGWIFEPLKSLFFNL
jgi:phage host-nuclease inhibitor protein Gam